MRASFLLGTGGGRPIHDEKTYERVREAGSLGWQAPDRFAGYKLSPPVVLEGGSPVEDGGADGRRRYALALLESAYELFDKRRDVVLMVRGIPTPERAAVLLEAYGVPTGEAVWTGLPPSLTVPEQEEGLVRGQSAGNGPPLKEIGARDHEGRRSR